MTAHGVGGMIDLHSHILPALDDGSRSLDETVRMARAAAADGVRTMVTTPHYDHPHFATERARADAAREAVVARLAEEGIALDLVPGGEVTLSAHTAERLQGGAVPVIGRGPYFLLELCDPLPRGLDQALFQLRLQGHHPILAHVERERTFQTQPEVLHRLVAQGALCQVTAMSVAGRFGRRAEKAARDFLEAGLVHFIASDAHNGDVRPPGLADAVAAATRLIGRDAEALVTRNPEQVVAGRMLEVEAPRPLKKRWR